MYVVSYVDYEGDLVQAEFDSEEEAQTEWDWANMYDFENLTMTEVKKN